MQFCCAGDVMNPRSAFLMCIFASLGGACTTASGPPRSQWSTTLTAAEIPDGSKGLLAGARALEQTGHCPRAKVVYARYAEAVRLVDRNAADQALAAAAACSVDEDLRAVTLDIALHDDPGAVAAADQAASAGATSPWLDYYRAVALADMRHTEEAVAAFRTAEQRLGNDFRARSIAIYGRARALDDASRCTDASRAYEEYGNAVRASDPAAAEVARKVSAHCR
jgi:hypothetical protein